MIERYIQRFRDLRGHTKPPHWRKRCMLLAVIEVAAQGKLHANEVRFADPLLTTYQRYFKVLEHYEDDQPQEPFRRLERDRFWHLVPKPEREFALKTMRRARSVAGLGEIVDHAVLDQDLHCLLQLPEARRRLREALCHEWRPEVTERVLRLAKRAEAAADWWGDPNLPGFAERLVDRVAEGAFHADVLAAYDYRCAATGWRILVPGGAPGPPAAPLIEVVRLLPHEKAKRDEVRFGMALAPTYSRAFQRGLIAPAPDMTWRVAPIFQQRIADHAPLLDMAGKQVIFTGDPQHRPARHALEWSVARLLT